MKKLIIITLAGALTVLSLATPVCLVVGVVLLAMGVDTNTLLIGLASPVVAACFAVTNEWDDVYKQTEKWCDKMEEKIKKSDR